MNEQLRTFQKQFVQPVRWPLGLTLRRSVFQGATANPGWPLTYSGGVSPLGIHFTLQGERVPFVRGQH